MENSKFDIKLYDLHWLRDIDETLDRCAHGHIKVRIGTEIVCDKETLEVAVNATALYLLRSLKSDYKKGDYASQMLPCCGHFMMADVSKDYVVICGCPNGIDWTITHTGDNKVLHTAESGSVAEIGQTEYKELVLEFADQVENFYKSSLPKAIPDNDIDREGYKAFWTEWDNLRKDASKKSP